MKGGKNFILKIMGKNMLNKPTPLNLNSINQTISAGQPITFLGDGRTLTYNRIRVMGILNTTVDSFYSASRCQSLKEGLSAAENMLIEGADILDIGGESTRPGSNPVSEAEESERVIPLIAEIKKNFPKSIVSIDTYHAKTAELALSAGADIINDISAMTFDKNMISVAAKYKAPIILMHMQGNPKNMQQQPHYTNVVQNIKEYLKERIEYALSKGLKHNQLLIDPGIGFGKSVDHNLKIMKHLDTFNEFGLPVLLAASRKSTIGKVLGELPPEECLEGTLATTAQAIFSGTHLIRVHDVKENIRFIRMLEAMRSCQ